MQGTFLCWVRFSVLSVSLIFVTDAFIHYEAVHDYNTAKQCKTTKQSFNFPNQILGCRQLITVHIRADGSIYNPTLQNLVGLRLGDEWNRLGKPPATTEGFQPIHSHNSCTLTNINANINKRKKYAGLELGLGMVCI